MELHPAVAQLAARHRISIDLPAEIFLERCVAALQSDQRNLVEVQKSYALGIEAWGRQLPNPGITREERVGVFDIGAIPASVARDENSCMDSVFPGGLGSLGFGD